MDFSSSALLAGRSASSLVTLTVPSVVFSPLSCRLAFCSSSRAARGDDARVEAEPDGPMVGLIWSSGKRRSSSLKKLVRRPVICKPAASTSSCGISKPAAEETLHHAGLPESRPQRVRPLQRMRLFRIFGCFAFSPPYLLRSKGRVTLQRMVQRRSESCTIAHANLVLGVRLVCVSYVTPELWLSLECS